MKRIVREGGSPSESDFDSDIIIVVVVVVVYCVVFSVLGGPAFARSSPPQRRADGHGEAGREEQTTNRNNRTYTRARTGLSISFL